MMNKNLSVFFTPTQSRIEFTYLYPTQRTDWLKINLINTIMEQNRTQEIVKINEELGEKVGKPYFLIE